MLTTQPIMVTTFSTCCPEWSLHFEHVVQSLLNTCLFGFHSWIRTQSHTTQILYRCHFTTSDRIRHVCLASATNPSSFVVNAAMLPRSFAERLRRFQSPPSYLSEIHLSLKSRMMPPWLLFQLKAGKKTNKQPLNFQIRIKDPWVSRCCDLASKQAITSRAIHESGPVRPCNVVVRRSTWSRRWPSTQSQGAALLNPGCITNWVLLTRTNWYEDSCRRVLQACVQWTGEIIASLWGWSFGCRCRAAWCS